MLGLDEPDNERDPEEPPRARQREEVKEGEEGEDGDEEEEEERRRKRRRRVYCSTLGTMRPGHLPEMASFVAASMATRTLPLPSSEEARMCGGL
jgi:hypothetical protein